MNIQEKELLERITVIPGLMNGKPTIRGLRFTVSDILEMLADGMSNADILEQHPILESGDIQASLLYASLRIKSSAVIYAS